MLNSAKVSIVIPVYNSEETLEKCISSIINQTYKNLEILIIDDCSTDSSFNIIEKYSIIDKRIRIFKNNFNQGQGFSRNVGLNDASGEYIYFVDSDDWIEEDTIEYMVNSIIEKCADIVISGYVQNQFIKKYESLILNSHFACLNMLNRNYSWAVWAKLFKKNIISNIRFPDTKMAEDLEFCCKVFSSNKLIIFVNEGSKYHYNFNPSSISYNYDTNRIFNTFVTMDYLKKNILTNTKLKALCLNNQIIYLFDFIKMRKIFMLSLNSWKFLLFSSKNILKIVFGKYRNREKISVIIFVISLSFCCIKHPLRLKQKVN